ncbi:MAG: Bax inhibitor-1 family protein [bacterium]
MTINTYKSKVLPIFAFFIAISGIGAYFSQFLSPNTQRIALISWIFIVVLSLIVRVFLKKLSGIICTVLVVLTGIILGPGINYIANTLGGEMLIAQALGITALAFIVLSVVAIRSGDQYLSWGKYLFFSLIIAILASIVNVFILSNMLQAIISTVILVIFLGFVLYDTQNILKNYSDDDYFNAATTLYFDFVNIFIYVLDFLDSIRGR